MQARALARLVSADVLLIAVQAAALLPLVVFRFIDGDEGVYLTAARLMTRGELPYEDFLYTQTPLLPYIYGAWGLLVGESWLATRLLSAAFACGTGLLLFRYLRARFGTSHAVAGFALYIGCGLTLVWYSTVKTYAFTALFLYAAYVVAERATPTALRSWAFSGILVGIAVDARLIVVGAAPPLAWAAWRTGRGRATLAFAGGVLSGLVPTVALLAITPERFVWDNLFYHAARSSGGLIGDFTQKLTVVAALLGIPIDDRPYPQYLLLVLPAALVVVVAFSARRRVPLSALVVLGLAVAALAPTPTYAQYFSVTVPFLATAAVEFASLAASLFRAASPPVAGRLFFVPLIAIYLAVGVPETAHVVRATPEDRIHSVSQVAAFLDARTKPGERVVSGWPGYLYGSNALPVKGLENDFAPHEAASVSVADAKRYHLASVFDVEQLIRTHRTRIVVAKPWENILPPVPDYAAVARHSGYRLLARVSGVPIYGLPTVR